MSRLAMTGEREPAQPTSAEQRAFRIAIVGGGPRGLYCLERLAEHLGRLSPRSPVNVAIFEPARYPGAGRTYDLDQPSYLRMNYAAGHINAWPPVEFGLSSRSPSLVQWLQQYHPAQADAAAYLPRPLVGQYLNWCFEQVAGEMRRIANVRIARAAVTHIRPDGRGWRLGGAFKMDAFDEVIFTVGHEGWRPSESAGALSDARDVKHVFPVESQLSMEHIRPGSVVAICGFGLTALDALLALTEGRGGRFEECEGKWKYHRSGREPWKIFFSSRSGRPMFAKPVVDQMRIPQAVEAIWEHHRKKLGELRRPDGGFDFARDLWPHITAAADEALGVCGDASAEQWFESWVDHPCHGRKAVETMRRSYAVATGRATPHAAWAVGEAWRQLYGPLSAQVSYGGLSESSWPEFHNTAAEMERIAFGPPAENMGRLLALIDCGIVDLEFVNGGRANLQARSLDSESGRERVAVDHFVNAVLPKPHEWCPHGPLAALIQSGILRRQPGSGAALINCEGRPLDAHGVPRQGLAVLGRATEGCVVGNDTLSRTSHHQPEAWAKSVVGRLSELSTSGFKTL